MNHNKSIDIQPLTEGSRWTYRIRWHGLESPDTVYTQRVAPEPWQALGHSYSVLVPDNEELPRLYLRADAEGLHRYDERSGKETWFLPSALNAAWSEPGPEGEQLFRITSVNERVTVAAGTFENCTRLEAQGGWSNGMQATILKAWFAPGVGMIGRIWTPDRSIVIAMELLEYSIASPPRS